MPASVRAILTSSLIKKAVLAPNSIDANLETLDAALDRIDRGAYALLFN